MMILSIQAKLSSMASLAKSKPRNLSKIQKQADILLKKSIGVNYEKNKDMTKFAYECGVLAAMTLGYLTSINSIQFDFHKKRFTINPSSLQL